MAEANLTHVYCNLLGVDNKRVLTNIADQIFTNVVRISVKAGLIVPPEGKEAAPSDLLDTGNLFSQAFKLTARIGSGEVRYRSLGRTSSRKSDDTSANNTPASFEGDPRRFQRFIACCANIGTSSHMNTMTQVPRHALSDCAGP